MTADSFLYFDNMASTPLDPRVIEAMHQCHSNPVLQANPHSQHHYGEVTAARILSETQKIADYFNVNPAQLTFTSGATEAINLAIDGVYRAYPDLGKHIISATTGIRPPWKFYKTYKTKGSKLHCSPLISWVKSHHSKLNKP